MLVGLDEVLCLCLRYLEESEMYWWGYKQMGIWNFDELVYR